MALLFGQVEQQAGRDVGTVSIPGVGLGDGDKWLFAVSFGYETTVARESIQVVDLRTLRKGCNFCATPTRRFELKGSFSDSYPRRRVQGPVPLERQAEKDLGLLPAIQHQRQTTEVIGVGAIEDEGVVDAVQLSEW